MAEMKDKIQNLRLVAPAASGGANSGGGSASASAADADAASTQPPTADAGGSGTGTAPAVAGGDYTGRYHLDSVFDDGEPILLPPERRPYVMTIRRGAQREDNDGEEFRFSIRIGNVLNGIMSIRGETTGDEDENGTARAVSVSRVASTKMRVTDPDLFLLERTVLKLFTNAEKIRFDDSGQLILGAGQGQRLVFERVPSIEHGGGGGGKERGGGE